MDTKEPVSLKDRLLSEFDALKKKVIVEEQDDPADIEFNDDVSDDDIDLYEALSFGIDDSDDVLNKLDPAEVEKLLQSPSMLAELVERIYDNSAGEKGAHRAYLARVASHREPKEKEGPTADDDLPEDDPWLRGKTGFDDLMPEDSKFMADRISGIKV